MSTYRTERIFLIGILMAMLGSVPGAFGEEPFPCADAIPVDLNSTSRFFSDEVGSSGVFVVETHSEGLLAVHAATPLGAGVEPQLRFLGADCGVSSRASSLEERSYVGGGELRLSSSGAYYVQVSSQDPALPLGDFKLIVGFAGDETGDGSGAMTKDGTGAGETDAEEVDETIPLLFECPVAEPVTISTKDGTGQGETEAEEVDETIPVMSGCLDDPARRDLCRLSQADDFGDVFTCATLLAPESSVTGSIRNDWRDDQDVFVVAVKDWTTLLIEVKGDFALLAALYDRHGQRLAPSRHQDGDSDLTLVETFAPGIYFLRIDGLGGAEGSYSLTIEEVGM